MKWNSLTPDGAIDKAQVDWKPEEVMGGLDLYPVFGECDAKISALIQYKFKGLHKYAGCLEKNLIAKHYLQGGNLVPVMGAIRVLSGDGASSYGFDFNPPFEFHAWLLDKDAMERRDFKHCVIDFSLPGVVLRGLNTSDEDGPFLVEREPIIICKDLPDWVVYKPIQVCPVDAIVQAMSHIWDHLPN